MQKSLGIVYSHLPRKVGGLVPFLGPLNQPIVRKYETLGNLMIPSVPWGVSTMFYGDRPPQWPEQLLGKKREKG